MMFLLGTFQTGEPLGVSWWVLAYFALTAVLAVLKSYDPNQR